MTRSNNTRRALLMSMVSILLCIAMLIGSTFAWFTDTASTNVGNIVSGSLDLKLSYEKTDGSWDNAEGQTLGWVQKTTANGATKIIEDDGLPLWEPGCTFTLPKLKIVNEGSLALKYKIAVTGIQGDAKLNEVIDWIMELDGSTETLGTEHKLAAKPAAGESANVFIISGKMKETAGNEYQNKSIEGISITVYATQDTVEFDSNDNQYDVSAMYPLMPKIKTTVTKDAPVDTDSKLTQAVKVSGSTIPVGTILYTSHAKEDSNKLTSIALTGGTLTEKIETTSDSSNEMTVSINYTYKNDNTDTSITAFSNAITHTLPLSKGLASVTVKHGESTMTAANSVADLKDGEYFYDSINGTLTIMSSTYSDFNITINHGFVAATNGQGYKSFSEVLDAVKDGGTIKLLDDITLTETTEFNRDLTIDLNGSTLNVDVRDNPGDGFVVNSGTKLILANSVAEHGIFHFKSNDSKCDGIYVHNTEADKTASLTVKNPVRINMEGKYNTAIHTFASQGKSQLTIEDGTLIDITTYTKMSGIQLDQNSIATMNGGEIKMTGNFENFSYNNDTVGVLIFGANSRQENIHFIMNGGKLEVGGTNAFAQCIQVGMVNGYSETVDITMNGGEICAGNNEGGESYALTAYDKDYATFIMNAGKISGTLTALSIDSNDEPVKLTVNGGTFYNCDPSDYVDKETHSVTTSEGADGATIYTVTANH